MYETDFKGCAHSALFSISWKFKGLHVIIMSRTRFGVNLHSIVCLNVKEPLARSRRHIWSLSDCNGIWTHNHLVRKRTLNHLVKLFRSSHINFRYGACFEQGVPWVQIYSEPRTWHDNNTQMHRTDKYLQSPGN